MRRRILRWFFLIVLGVAALLFFESGRVPCRTPLLYTVGQFDERFGMSEADFRAAILAAEGPWEAALGRNIFEYRSGAAFPVNLIFDERQARTIEAKRLEREFARVQDTQEEIQGGYVAASARLSSARRQYETSVAAFEARRVEYNERVTRWNRSARTEMAEFDWIQDEERTLRREQSALEEARVRVNALVAEANRFVRQEAQVVDRYQAQVHDFTAMYGTAGAFDQGLYAGTSIDIYQFDDRDHLIMALTHELGHALGIGHVDNPVSIMYPVMSAQDVQQRALSAEDKSALLAVCRVTAWELLLRDVRQAWRALIT